MKLAKQRWHAKVARPKSRPRYRLADLLAQMPEGKFEWTPELRVWEEMRPVGREFGSDEAGLD